VHEITEAVDVSERTFFRYFASKEDLVLSFVKDGQTAFAEALAARPPAEDPFTAVRNAFQISLRQLPGRSGEASSYLSVMGLIDSTPGAAGRLPALRPRPRRRDHPGARRA